MLSYANISYKNAVLGGLHTCRYTHTQPLQRDEVEAFDSYCLEILIELVDTPVDASVERGSLTTTMTYIAVNDEIAFLCVSLSQFRP